MLQLRTLLTSAVCLVFGACLGVTFRKELSLPVAQKDSEPKRAMTITRGSSDSRPPPFTSVTATMEWVRSEMRLGRVNAAEDLFFTSAGLTDDQRFAVAKELVNSFRRMDPWMLSRVVLSLPRGEQSDRLLWSLVSTWSGEDAEGALRFIEALPADRLNTVGVLQNAAWGLCRLPADRVLAFAAQLTDKGRSCLADGLTAFADQAGSWRNSAAILAKLNAKPHEDVYSAERHLGQHLAEIDPQGMEGLIAAESDVTKRDEMLQGYSWVIGLKDPARGIALDSQISDPKDRQRQIENHVEQWLSSDRASALAWLQGDVSVTLMTLEQRGKLLKSYGQEAAR